MCQSSKKYLEKDTLFFRFFGFISDAAALCLQNLRKTFKYGGRKNVPLREEVQALAVSLTLTIAKIGKRALCKDISP